MIINEGKPCGTEPFDKTYGLGYSTGHSGYSPYERVNHLREVFLDRRFNIDTERAVLVTEAWRANEDASPEMKNALALKNVLENVNIDLYDHELIAGEIAAPAKAAPIYPEFSVDWIIDELENHPFDERENDKFYITDEDRDLLLKILPYWRGKTVSDYVTERVSDQAKRGSQMGKRVFMANLYQYAGIGHFVMDYGKLMHVGFSGIISEIDEQLARLTDDESEDADRRKNFLMASRIELVTACSWILRYARLSEERAQSEHDEKQRNELVQISDNCRQIAGGPAKTMWQALQLWYFATAVTQIESNGHSVSYGRMDQWLYPYYESDINEGRISKDFAQELLECTYIKMGNASKLKDRQSTALRNGRGWGGESLTIGGVDGEGNDVTNDLTFMMLEASVHTRMMDPWVCVRMHPGTPYELKVKAIECIRAGYGHPKLFNDSSAIKVMLEKGMTLEEARDYAVVGCVEPDLPGREFGLHDASYFNLARVLELSLNHGRCLDCSAGCPLYKECAGAGKSLGPDTGSIEDASSIDEVLDSFDRQLEFWVGQMCGMLDTVEEAHRMIKPTPYASSFFEGCIGSGRDLMSGGAKYNFTGPQGSGIATCADAFSAINNVLFENKMYTGAQMLDALKKNWEGYKLMYTWINGKQVPHFGNDDDAADKYYIHVFDTYCSLVSGKKNPRGGVFCPGVYSVNANVSMGIGLPATPDGRKQDEPISDNMGPVHTDAGSHDVSGPTAIANSVNKVDHTKATNGTLLNWKFPPDCVSGKKGRDNLISFTDGYFAGSGMHSQFNIMSTETMRKAMETPEDYRDLLVRVAGYSAYFVELSKPLQMDLINRTELSF